MYWFLSLQICFLFDKVALKIAKTLTRKSNLTVLSKLFFPIIFNVCSLWAVRKYWCCLLFSGSRSSWLNLVFASSILYVCLQVSSINLQQSSESMSHVLVWTHSTNATAIEQQKCALQYISILCYVKHPLSSWLNQVWFY